MNDFYAFFWLISTEICFVKGKKIKNFRRSAGPSNPGGAIVLHTIINTPDPKKNLGGEGAPKNAQFLTPDQNLYPVDIALNHV